jgi:hypothetical protein
MTEKGMLSLIDGFGKELIRDRGVKLDSIVLDDGWDDMHTLWLVNKANFPKGLKPLSDRAAEYGTHIGAWLSPWGGYGGAHDERLKYGKEQGFETHGSGFSLAGPTYYKRFSDVCKSMIDGYGANYFKFDGPDAGRIEETESLLRLDSDLRRKSPDIFINMTVGTWPSPFWLRYGDSTWRGGGDTSQSGEGSARERWINYRDSITCTEVVSRAPLYPLNSLMIHGVVLGHSGEEANAPITGDSLAHEIYSYFGTGTGLQELYISPDKMRAREWDTLAEAARWSRANSDVLVDSHWVGGDPSKGEVYGWASWSKRKGIITLRCPSTKPGTIVLDIGKAFELPSGAATTYTLRSPWKKDANKAPITLTAGTPYTFTLQPFEVLTLESDAKG